MNTDGWGSKVIERRLFLRIGAAATGAGSALLVHRPAKAPPKKPVVTTSAATDITSTGARLNGTVNPKGSATTYHFQYGLTTAYGSTTPVTSAGSGNTPVPVFADISGLASNATYHFRILATNAGGTSIGADAAFTTLLGGGVAWPATWPDIWPE